MCCFIYRGELLTAGAMMFLQVSIAQLEQRCCFYRGESLTAGGRKLFCIEMSFSQLGKDVIFIEARPSWLEHAVVLFIII